MLYFNVVIVIVDLEKCKVNVNSDLPFSKYKETPK